MGRRPRLDPLVGVVAMVVTLLAASGMAWAEGLTGAGSLTTPRVPWWVLAPLFAVVEATVLHVQVRREAQAVSLNEIPLVLALFLTSPPGMLAAGVLGAVVVYLGYRRQSLLKAAFNTTVRVFGVTLALAIFHTLAGPAAGIGPRAWLAALAGVGAAGVSDGLLVLVVVTLHEGGLRGRDVRRELLTTPPASAVVGAVGLIAVVMLHADPGNAVLLVAVGAALVAGYRAHASLHDRHVSLARLYDFGRAVNDAHQIQDVLTSVLTGARDLLKAEAAELVLLANGTEQQQYHRWVLPEGSTTLIEQPVDDQTRPALWSSVLDGGGPLLLPRHRGGRRASPQLTGSGYREAVVVPVLDESGILGHLMVAERMGQVRTFHAADIPLLETVANQAGLALRNSRLVERLRREALHDVLTGLANRAKFRDDLTQALAGIRDSESPGLSVLLLDLDGFKDVNDSLGHHNGDTLLVHVAQQLMLTTGPDQGRTDPATHPESGPGGGRPVAAGPVTVARLGGDEFAVLLPGVSGAEVALAVADRIHRAIDAPILIEGVEVAVRASIGIALAPTHGRDPAALLRRADGAMYTAKTSGGGTHLHRLDRRPDQTGQTPLALLAELRKAIEGREVIVHVQPQAHASTGGVYGAEALIRWNHPTLGVLPPTEFLSLADRHGLLHDLTQTVLDQAVEVAAGWRTAGLDLTISVNLSARSLTDNRLLPAVEAVLRRHQLPPSHLTLELTEDCVIDDPDRAIALLDALRGTGVRLAVDDFGTGYSSLSYLRRLPVHEVKIDRSFITSLADDTESQVIVRAITDLGTNLGLHVIAEGVEDQNSWNHLTGLGCHAIQGYHLARPMPPDHLPPWLHGYRTRRPPQGGAALTAPARPRLHAI